MAAPIYYSFPILFLLCGLATPAILAGIGLLLHQNWARRLGMIMTGIFLFLALYTLPLLIQFPVSGALRNYPSQLLLLLLFTFIVVIAVLYLSLLLGILGGNRMARSTGQIVTRPGGIWPVIVVFSATLFGFIPAMLLLSPSRASRTVARITVVLLILFMFIVTIFAFTSASFPEAVFVFFIFLVLVGLCVWIFMYLNQPHVKNYYEGQS